MPDAAPEPPAGRSFEDMLADPGEQFDPRSELLASIAAYAAAPSDTPSAAPRPLAAPGVVAGLLADVADARAQLAGVQHGAGAWIREAVARETAGLTARLAEVTADRAHLAAKLAETLAANQRWAETLGDVQQAGRERDDARSAFAKLAALFTQGAQSGWTARVSGTVLRRLCVMAMCEPPSGATDNIEAAAMVLFRDYESQCQADHLTWRDFADLARAVIEAA